MRTKTGFDLYLHQGMISDKIRMEAFKDAIFKAVKKDHVVLDIGSGTGILSFMAIQAGAKKVYSVEERDIIDISRRVARDNNLGDKITFIRGNSKKIELPEKVDIIISELLGPFGLEEDILDVLRDGKTRFLKEGGIIIPESLELEFALTGFSPAYEKVKFWETSHYGINFNFLSTLARDECYIDDIPSETILTGTVKTSPLNLCSPDNFVNPEKMIFEVIKSGIICGLASWFKVKLFEDITLCTSPFSPPTHWKQMFFPVSDTVEVKSNQKVTLRIIPKTRFGYTVNTRQVIPEVIRTPDVNRYYTLLPARGIKDLLYLGSKYEQIEKVWGKPHNKILLDNNNYCVLYNNYNMELFFSGSNSLMVVSITSSNNYITDKGIKFYSSLDDIIKCYGKNYFKEETTGETDFNISYPHLGIIFGIKDEKVVEVSLNET